MGGTRSVQGYGPMSASSSTRQQSADNKTPSPPLGNSMSRVMKPSPLHNSQSSTREERPEQPDVDYDSPDSAPCIPGWQPTPAVERLARRRRMRLNLSQADDSDEQDEAPPSPSPLARNPQSNRQLSCPTDDDWGALSPSAAASAYDADHAVFWGADIWETALNAAVARPKEAAAIFTSGQPLTLKQLQRVWPSATDKSESGIYLQRLWFKGAMLVQFFEEIVADATKAIETDHANFVEKKLKAIKAQTGSWRFVDYFGQTDQAGGGELRYKQDCSSSKRYASRPSSASTIKYAVCVLYAKTAPDDKKLDFWTLYPFPDDMTQPYKDCLEVAPWLASGGHEGANLNMAMPGKIQCPKISIDAISQARKALPEIFRTNTTSIWDKCKSNQITAVLWT